MNITFALTCPRCGSDVEAVKGEHPKGMASRERHLVVSCSKLHCRWGGHVVVELVDALRRKDVA